MDFQPFLEHLLSLELPNVASFDNPSARGSRAIPDRRVLIGCGSWDKPQHDGTLLLQNKGAAIRFGKSFSSVTKFVTEAPLDFFESWAAWPKEVPDLQAFVSSLQLVGEDGSPDSIFGLFFLLARVARVPVEQYPGEWIQAVDAWERTGNADDPYRSWCSLESALAHSSLSGVGLSGRAVYTRAWQEGLRFAASSISEGFAPLALPVPPTLYEHGRAFSALEQDEQVYREWLLQSPAVQLLLPVADLPGRFRLVDTLFIEEPQLTGAAKNFYRNDVVNSPLHGGFTLSVVYRPQSTEARPDVTITVDPRKRVSLLDLWASLEKAETAAWQRAGEIRPTHMARQPDGIIPQFTEPWFINRERTLVGAPRKFPDTDASKKFLDADAPQEIPANFAGRLERSEIQDVILHLCNPLNNVQVLAEKASPPVPILSLRGKVRRQALQAADDEKRFLMVSWPSQQEQTGILLPSVLPQAPTVRRLLATLIRPERAPKDIGLKDLVEETTFDQISLTGGFAIVSDWGVFVLNDWSAGDLDDEALRTVFEKAACMHVRLLKELEPKLEKVSEHLTALLRNDRTVAGRDVLVTRLSLLRMQAAELRSTTVVSSADPNARLLKQAIDKRWLLKDRLCALEGQIDAVGISLRSMIDAKIASVNRFIAVDGFALFVASGLAAPVAKTFYHVLGAHHPTGDAPGWWILAAFAALTIALLGLLHLWLKRKDPLRKSATDSALSKIATDK